MISIQKLTSLLSSAKDMNVLVLGDLILDHYLYGQVNRISPEAPVPILLSENEEFRLGGAGNVFLNLVSLGSRACLIGVTGDDEAGERIKALTPDRYQGVVIPGRTTPIKTRLIANRQQILRIDREKEQPIERDTAKTLLEMISDFPADAILLSDYAKGFFNLEFTQNIIRIAKSRSIPLIADPKPANIHFFRNATAITPNRAEAEKILGIIIDSDEDASRAVSILIRKLQSESAVITRGAQGVTARLRGHKSFHLPAFSHEVFDVTGAGDTFASLLVLGTIAGLPLRQVLWLANAAASIVIERIGAVALTGDELIERCRRLRKQSV